MGSTQVFGQHDHRAHHGGAAQGPRPERLLGRLHLSVIGMRRRCAQHSLGRRFTEDRGEQLGQNRRLIHW